MRTATALALERLIGWPEPLTRRIGHPVVWIGAALDRLERRWNRPEAPARQRRASGVATVLLMAGGAALVGVAVEALVRRTPAPELARAVAALPGLAQRSLAEHVEAVMQPLQRDDLHASRQALSRIVGRDTHELDQAELARAALESLAESFNDAVVAPAFWLCIAGLPGLYAYKAVNTADSMIGHLEPRWRDFGWAAARLDDLMNLAPARLAGGLIVLAGRGGWRTMLAHAPRHPSPNSGWPEAAMAGALGVRLGGPVHYDGALADRPWLGDGREPRKADLVRGLRIYGLACVLLLAGVTVVELAVQRRRAQ